MKFGASIWPFQWDPPYEDGISRIASLGFEAVELIGWNRQILHEYFTPKKVKELRAFAEDAGLEISEFVSTPEGMASPDEKERDRAVEHFKRAVEVAVGLGTGIVNTVSAYPFDLEFPRITDRPHLQQWIVDVPSGFWPGLEEKLGRLRGRDEAVRLHLRGCRAALRSGTPPVPPHVQHRLHASAD
jgi:sugar phosphate isomerase/epimerase